MRVHTQYPAFFSGECVAFYRIFFRHEYDVGISTGYVIWCETVMIGKRVGLYGQPKFIQVREEALRMADTGDGAQALAMEIGSLCQDFRVEQVVKTCTVQLHAVFAFSSGSSIDDDCIHFRQAGRRLAQRPCGKQETIAEAAYAIHHGNLNIALQAVMLQAVVAEYHIAFRMGA